MFIVKEFESETCVLEKTFSTYESALAFYFKKLWTGKDVILVKEA